MFTSLQKSLLSCLADQELHSGAKLAASLGVSRTAVWKAVHQLREAGFPVIHAPGRGYRLAFPYQPLSAEAIRAAAGAETVLAEIQVHDLIDSTNTHLLELARQGAAHGAVVLAEGQLRGRGRRGRVWCSPPGENLYLSVLLRFDPPVAALGTFSLVAGLALAEALSELGIRGHGVKWPNDVWHQGRKLAGILSELQGEVQGPCALVVGIGVNVHARESGALPVDQPWTSLILVQPGAAPDRNVLAGRLLAQLFRAYELFCQSGLGAFEGLWERYDLLRGRAVQVSGLRESLVGIACGVSPEGHLRVAAGGQVHHLHSGEVSVRPHGHA
ncbi:MAG: biotin--[acetyl-CoA-carboxylase] ligase [Pseudomonadota bacterium]